MSLTAAFAPLAAAVTEIAPAALAALAEPVAELLDDRSPWTRMLGIAAVALLLHLLVLLIRRVSEWIASPDTSPALARELLTRRRPRLATVATLLASALTFAIYFIALGLILNEVGTDLRVYFASATVIGLAVAFGSQGLVQDVVIGVTLVFSDALNVGDIVEISGQVGRVEKVGLRFTMLSNFVGQTVYVPNRNIGVIGRYRRGAVRAYIDVQISRDVDAADIGATVERTVNGVHRQHPSVIVANPEIRGPFDAAPGDWRYLRIRLLIWPGQQSFVEGSIRQRLIAALKHVDPDFADWMVSVTYRGRISEERS